MSRSVKELWVSPGADSPELLARAAALGLEPCSLRLGEPPATEEDGGDDRQEGLAMELTETAATLGVGMGDERLVRLTPHALTAEVSPEYWARIAEELRRRLDDGTLVGGALGAVTTRSLPHLKRWYLGPHDLALVDVTFDGQTVRVCRHGLGDLFGGAVPSVRDHSWYATLDAVGGAWSEGFDPQEAQRPSSVSTRCGMSASLARLRPRVRTRTFAAAVGVAGIVAAVAWTMRGPKKPS